MVKYFSEDYFKELERRLSADPKWTEDTKGIKTSVLLAATDQGSSYVLRVEEGKTSIARAEQGAQAEFSFDGTYEVWTKVAKGEVDLQSAVLKGLLKFRGSITKILFYKDRFMRIAETLRSIEVEF
jgi:putative sterol carrier protein